MQCSKDSQSFVAVKFSVQTTIIFLNAGLAKTLQMLNTAEI